MKPVVTQEHEDRLVAFLIQMDRTECVALPPAYYDPDHRIRVTRNGLRTFLHRELYRRVVGEISSYTFLLKSCPSEDCVSPWHRTVSTTSTPPRPKCRNAHYYTPEDIQPDGSRICHVCAERRRERRNNGGLAYWQIEKQRTHCPYYHPLTPENTYVYPTKYGGVRRRCKACTKARSRGLDPQDIVLQ